MESGERGSGGEGPMPVEGGAIVRASVIVDGVETWYGRWGSGPCLLVFLRDPLDWAPPFWLRTLSGPERRLLFPELRPELAATLGTADGPSVDQFCAWLRGFLDGLGLNRVEVAYEPAFDAMLGAAAAEDPERFAGPIFRVVPPYRR